MKSKQPHKNTASSSPTSAVMSSNIISPSDAGLVLARLITGRVAVIALFVSKDGRVRTKVQGYVESFEPSHGLSIATPYSCGADRVIQACLTIDFDLVAAATFRYNGETKVSPSFDWSSGLRIDLPNGDTLTIADIREDA